MEDICANRHQGNEESIAAFERGSLYFTEQRQRVYELIQAQPRTMKEIAAAMGVQLNTVSGRGSELKKMGLVAKTGEVREGSAVLAVRR